MEVGHIGVREDGSLIKLRCSLELMKITLAAHEV